MTKVSIVVGQLIVSVLINDFFSVVFLLLNGIDT
jgi:hypothetical protein